MPPSQTETTPLLHHVSLLVRPQVGLIHFATGSTVSTTLVQQLTSDVDSVIQIVEDLDYSNGLYTPTDVALETYQTEMAARGRAGSSKICVLLSDGVPQKSNGDTATVGLAIAEVGSPWPPTHPFTASNLCGSSTCRVAQYSLDFCFSSGGGNQGRWRKDLVHLHQR